MPKAKTTKATDLFTLTAIKSFVRAKDVEGAHDEIRAFVQEHLDAVARVLNVTCERLTEATDAIVDDRDLVKRLLGQLETEARSGRDAKATERRRQALYAAASVAMSGHWVRDRFYFEASDLLAALGASGESLIINAGDRYRFAVPFKKLLQLEALKLEIFHAWIDSRGIHFRWATGGLSFCSSEGLDDSDVGTVVMPLPDCPAFTPRVKRVTAPVVAPSPAPAVVATPAPKSTRRLRAPRYMPAASAVAVSA